MNADYIHSAWLHHLDGSSCRFKNIIVFRTTGPKKPADLFIASSIGVLTCRTTEKVSVLAMITVFLCVMIDDQLLRD